MKSINFLTVLLLVLFLFGCGEKKTPPVPVGEMQEYRDPGYGFKIKYPSDWKQLGQVGKAVFAKSDEVILRFQDFKSGEPGGMATVTVTELQGRTPQDVMTSANDEMKQYAQMKPEQQVQVAGKQATRIDYSFQATKKNQVEGFVVYVPGDTALYAVDFKGFGDQFEAHKAVFDAMLASFQLPVIVAKKSDVWNPKSPTDLSAPYFTMEYPEDMNFATVKKADKDYVVELRAPDRNDCSIHVDVYPAKGLTLDKVWAQSKGVYRGTKNTGQANINGNTAYWIDYSLRGDVSSRAYFMVKNDKIIRTTLNWYTPQKDVYFTALEKIVNSMKLK